MLNDDSNSKNVDMIYHLIHEDPRVLQGAILVTLRASVASGNVKLLQAVPQEEGASDEMARIESAKNDHKMRRWQI